MIDIFVSSDTASITAGSNWLDSIDTALRNASTEIVICSKVSITRPWINFEAGAGWMRSIPIIPVCHSGLHPRDLPLPLSLLQAVDANKEIGIDRIYQLISNQLGVAKANPNFKQIIKEIASFEESYIPLLQKTSESQTSKEAAALAKIKDLLKEESFTWRTIDTLAIKGGITQSEAMEILRKDQQIEFGQGKSGKPIAKLKFKSEGLKVFLSYSHKDEDFKDELVMMLAGLQRHGIIDAWQDRRIEEGDEWYQEIQDAINNCDLAILLVSANFIASRFIQDEELPKLLKRRVKDGLQVVPIIVKPCLWQSQPLIRDIQVLPRDGKPVITFSKDNGDRDQVWTDIANAIEKRAK